jgi:RND family efflux transporter MFP subunit
VARAGVEAARASIQVNEAAVKRYADLQNFEKITAPFAGVITARHVEVGDLVTADSTTWELYHLMRTDILRINVNVPQAFATSVAIGQGAEVYRRDEPQKKYPGKVARTANALDPNTRTLLTEVDVANPEDALRPGMYLQVKFAFDRKVFPLMIPAAALATRIKGPCWTTNTGCITGKWSWAATTARRSRCCRDSRKASRWSSIQATTCRREP